MTTHRHAPLGAAAALLLAAAPALAQAPQPAAPMQTSPVQTCELGNLQLESGAVIPNFRMTYITHGTLNAERSNGILSLHGLRGDRTTQTPWAGPGQALDTGRFFVIQPDTLGVASLDPNATTSPTRSGLNMEFPRFTMRDMVTAEHRMLTECLRINRLVAVTGTSMGGIGAMQWAVQYPDFMQAVIPLVPQARANRQVSFIWEAARQTIMLDPKWRGGQYPADDPPRMGVGIGLLVQNAFGISAGGFEEQFASPEQVHRFYAQLRDQTGATTQARDWVYRTWAIESHDVSRGFGGDMAAAGRAIKARLLLFPNCFDQLLPPGESGVMEIAAHAPDVKIVDIDDLGGHGGTRSPKGTAVITSETRDLLQRVSDGRPGFSGPRYPRHWSRPDRCPG